MCKFCIKLWKTGTLSDPFKPPKKTSDIQLSFTPFLSFLSFYFLFLLILCLYFLNFTFFLVLLLRKLWLLFYCNPLHLELFLLIHFLLLFFLLIHLLLLPIQPSSFASYPPIASLSSFRLPILFLPPSPFPIPSVYSLTLPPPLLHPSFFFLFFLKLALQKPGNFLCFR